MDPAYLAAKKGRDPSTPARSKYRVIFSKLRPTNAQLSGAIKERGIPKFPINRRFAVYRPGGREALLRAVF
jgi:hypothetical protein